MGGGCINRLFPLVSQSLATTDFMNLYLAIRGLLHTCTVCDCHRFLVEILIAMGMKEINHLASLHRYKNE